MPPGEEIDREFSVLQPECSRATKPLPPPFPRCEGERDKVKGEYCPRETCASLTETPPLECLQIFEQSLLVLTSPRILGTALSSANRLSHRVGDLFASHISVAFDEGTAFEIEELADLKWIAGARGEKLPFDYLVVFHLLRAIPAQPSEFIIFVSERSGDIAVDAGRERIGDTHRLVVLAMRHQDRSFNALLIDDAPEKAIHAFRESIMGKRCLEKTHAFKFVRAGVGSRRRDDAPAEAVADEVDALHLRSQFVDELCYSVLADVSGAGLHLEISRKV